MYSALSAILNFGSVFACVSLQKNDKQVNWIIIFKEYAYLQQNTNPRKMGNFFVVHKRTQYVVIKLWSLYRLNSKHTACKISDLWRCWWLDFVTFGQCQAYCFPLFPVFTLRHANWLLSVASCLIY